MAAPRDPGPPPVPEGPGEPARWRKRIARYIADHGIPVDPEGYEAIARADGRPAAGRTVAAYDPRQGKVLLNQRHPFWRSPVELMRAAYRAGSLSSDSPAHPAFQEVAHQLHRLAVGADRYAELRGRRLTPDEDAIAARVSAYARTSPVEFVAEAFAALRAGRPLDPDVMAIYNQLGGPPP
jgi:hypothetical protein